MKIISLLAVQVLSKISSDIREKVDCLCRCVNASDRSQNDDPGSVEEPVDNPTMLRNPLNFSHCLRKKLVNHVNRIRHEARSKDEATSWRAAINSLLSHMDKNQLTNLVNVIEKECDSKCVFVRNVKVLYGKKEVEPHVLTWILYRGLDTAGCDMSSLRSTPICRRSDGHGKVCCNPYHWSIVATVSESPPPYSGFTKDSTQNGINNREIESTETGAPWSSDTPGEGSDGLSSRPWCRIAYWEKNCLLNRESLYAVHTPFVHVFQHLPHTSGLSLESVQTNWTRSGSPLPHDPGGGGEGGMDADVKHTRDKIGAGVIVSHEDLQVWIYNQSSQPVFVYSPTLQLPNVYKIPAGHCMLVYDFSKDALSPADVQAYQPLHSGPCDNFSVKLSFVKGWGRGYKRQSNLDCPCWLEILLQPDKNR